MLLEVKENQLIVDDKPLVEGFRAKFLNLEAMRIKTNYITEDGHSLPIDLNIHYQLPSITSFAPPTMSIKFEGKEMIQDMYFKIHLSWEVLKGKFHLKGKVGKRQIDQYVEKSLLLEIFELLVTEIKKDDTLNV